MEVNASTVSGNQSLSGGGMGNSGGCDFSAAANDHVGTITGPIDAKLKGFRDNGGATYTPAPSAHSPL